MGSVGHRKTENGETMELKKREIGKVTKWGRKWPWLVIFVVVLVCSCGRGKEEEPPKEVVRPVKLFNVSSEVETDTRELPGRVRASKRADLAFQVSGPLTQFPVEEGDLVKKGELVAQILPRNFKTDLGTAKANELEAMHQYNRYKDLYIKKQVSKSDFDKAKRGYDVAKSDVETAHNALEDTSLRAPFSGVIAKRYVENFQEVRAKDPIVSLQDVSELEILVDVPEVSMSSVRGRGKGTAVAQVEFTALPGMKYDLTLKEFSTEADPQTQTYRVVLALPAPKEATILPGMTAKVMGKKGTDMDTSEKGFFVPVNAVFSDEEGNEFVWVVDPETMAVEKRGVSVGRVSGGSISVLEGLEPGNIIVAAGVNYLRPGMKIRELRAK